MGELAEDALDDGTIQDTDEFVAWYHNEKKGGTMTQLLTRAAMPQRASAVKIPTLTLLDDTPLRPLVILNAVEGWGKTTYAAHAPNVAVIMARGESGYITLRKAGRVPSRPQATANSWAEVLGIVDQIGGMEGIEYIALDAMSGFERLCHEHVCRRDFDSDWGEKGFGMFQKGYDVSIAEWLLLLQRLDQLHQEKNVGVILLSHSRVRLFKNPMGPDFDKYLADCHEKTWAVTAKWADAILFGTFQTVTEEDRKSKRVKGTGGTQRVLYTEQTDAYVAKNRYGMPSAIAMPDDPAATFQVVADAMGGKKAGGSDIPE